MSKVEGLVIRYNVTDGAIAEIAEKFKDAEAETADGYKNVVAGIRCTRELRVDVETRRKELKRDALDYGKRVDDEAKRITASLLDVEHPLKLLKRVVDDEKFRVRREAEEARLAAEREKLEAERVAKEAEMKAEREAEEARLAAEREKLEVEREALKKERAEEKEKQRKIEAARREKREAEEVEHREQREAEKAEWERKKAAEGAKRKAEEIKRRERIAVEEKGLAERLTETNRREADQKAREEERAKMEREQKAKAEHEVAIAEAATRRKAALPDVEQLKLYTDALLDLEQPKMTTGEAQAVLGQIDQKLIEAQKLVEDFLEEGW